MSDLLLSAIDIFFLASLIFNLYWQAQIIVPAKYKVSSLVLTALFAVWILAIPIHSWLYIIMVAAVLTVTIMQGTGGLGSRWLVTNGFFAGVVNYQKLAHITLIPVQLPTMRPQVITIFTTISRQNIQMTFNHSWKEIQHELRQLVPDHIPIDVTQL